MEILAFIPPMLALLQGSSQLYLVGFGFAAGTAVIGSGIGMGYLFGQTIASIHRQPEAFELSRTWLFVGIGLVEAQALFGLAFALLIGLQIF
ncbi:MAG TPA: ATP synthase F0 subunit C [Rubrobacter sp.]|jgi:F-type H+-transporting ATPase subunit c|nr:ATP synthase F0 subunit C [Rubrobacter sp.]